MKEMKKCACLSTQKTILIMEENQKFHKFQKQIQTKLSKIWTL